MNKKLLTLYNYVSFECCCDWAVFLDCVGGGSVVAGLRTIKQALTSCKSESDVQALADQYI